MSSMDYLNCNLLTHIKPFGEKTLAFKQIQSNFMPHNQFRQS